MSWVMVLVLAGAMVFLIWIMGKAYESDVARLNADWEGRLAVLQADYDRRLARAWDNEANAARRARAVEMEARRLAAQAEDMKAQVAQLAAAQAEGAVA